MMRSRSIVLTVFAIILAGCGAPHARLTFPDRPLKASSQPQKYDVNGNGRDDFAISFDVSSRVDALTYDDDEDGNADRIYHLRDYAGDRLPHLIILLDSVPFQVAADRYAAGEFRWFDPPRKVIAPFPTLTEVCYTELLHAPPMPGVIDQHYDRGKKQKQNGLSDRFFDGYEYPWERQLDYRCNFSEEAYVYLKPRPWYQAELERARKTLNDSPNAVTIVYISSASGMACKYGREGINEVLDGAARLCLQLLYERHGAIRISVMADHGHNMAASKNIDVAKLLRAGGFKPGDSLNKPDDAVLEVNGLVTYAGVRTTQPAKVADCLLAESAIDMTFYVAGDQVLIRDAHGSAAIDCRDGRLRYRALTRDVLDYEPVVQSLRRENMLDSDGFASRDNWFAATADHAYPDAPPRLWDAFHRLVVDPPEVMFTTRDGFCAGLPSYEKFITMKSTHGSLNQINSATFLMTMHGGDAELPLRTWDVMTAIEPNWRPGVKDKR